MWTVTILFGGGGSVNLIYEDSQRAISTYETLEQLRKPADENYDPQVRLTDDFGTKAVIDIAEVICHTMQDVKKAQHANGELQLLNMKANMAMQQKAQRDPALKLMMGQPGGMIT